MSLKTTQRLYNKTKENCPLPYIWMQRVMILELHIQSFPSESHRMIFPWRENI